MGCSVEDLAIVLLTHEPAHAYTQLGADIEGRRWPARAFSEAESSLKEGLAQYYTDRVLRRSERRYPRALKVFVAMLPSQPDAYRTHLPWTKGLLKNNFRFWRERRLARCEARGGSIPASGL